MLFADDLLPGVGEEEVTLGQGLRIGGVSTFVVLLLLSSFDELESATLSVLAPDIRDAFGRERRRDRVHQRGVGRVPRARRAADGVAGRPLPRGRRSSAGRASLFAAMVSLCGLAVNAFTLFLARFGVGIAKSNAIPVQGSLIADAYPIGVRGRISA